MIFTSIDIMSILPEIIIAGAACLLLLVELILPPEKKRLVPYLAICFVLLAAWYSWHITGAAPVSVFAGMFTLDLYSTYFKFILYAGTLLAILISLHYVEAEGIVQGEYYVLMLFSLCGMMVVASGADLLTIYLGIELMSLPIYVLVGLKQKDKRSNEAAMKYIILGAFASGVFLYGISLVYGITGTTHLATIGRSLDLGGPGAKSPLFILALMMLVAGLGFKVAAFPFHMWAPDVYEGAPTPITAFMSVALKAAAFAAIVRVFIDAFGPVYDSWKLVVSIVAVSSLVIGNVVAIAQRNIKRMLAYSSIGHAGYALLGVVAGTYKGAAGVMFYMLVYTFMNIGAFAVIIMMKKGKTSGERIDDYKGLARSNKLLALVMMVFMFSLAGVPPTGGFVGKFYIFMALIDQGFVSLAVIALTMSAVGAYFYIRIVMYMYMKEPEGEFEFASSTGLIVAIGVSVAAVIALGVMPGYLVELAQKAAGLL